tara:strand:- start:17 stop:127 length:111 start_codon:yes stop_codon:yes gene_type:complete
MKKKNLKTLGIGLHLVEVVNEVVRDQTKMEKGLYNR